MGKIFGYVNRYAFHSDPKVYVCCLLCYLLSAVNAFVTLSYTEYNINAAYYLLKGEETFMEVLPIMVGFLCVMVLFLIIGWIQNLLENKLIIGISYKFNQELNAKLSDIRWDYFESHAAFLKIQECRVRTLDELIHMFQKSMALFGMIPTIFVYGYFLSRISAVAVVLFLGTLFVFNRTGTKIKSASSEIWQKIRPYTERQKYYFELCGDKVTHQEYQFNRLYHYFFDKWKDAYETEIKLRMKIHRNVEVSVKMAQILFYMPRLFMLLYVTYGIMNGKYEIGFFVMANTMLSNISNHMTSMQEIFEIFRTRTSFITAFQEVMKYSEQESIQENCAEIEMKEIVYQYPQSSYKALNGLNLRVKQGEKIAVIGENGSGKTTCVNMILSLTNPVSGCVKRCGVENISSIIQDFAQYQATVKENIMYGCPWRTFSDDEVWNILELVGLKKKVRSLPEGIYTKLGQLEKGVELSKGQWQRLAIARLLANPKAKIWILDEPTAYLDPISEIEIYELIYRLAGERTVLFISHRLGFAKRADRIIVFQNGKIVENGTHEILIGQKGIYEKMYRLQEAWYIE